jgi:hypothetical protein
MNSILSEEIIRQHGRDYKYMFSTFSSINGNELGDGHVEMEEERSSIRLLSIQGDLVQRGHWSITRLLGAKREGVRVVFIGFFFLTVTSN